MVLYLEINIYSWIINIIRNFLLVIADIPQGYVYWPREFLEYALLYFILYLSIF